MNVDMQNAYIAGLASGGLVEQKERGPLVATVTEMERITATIPMLQNTVTEE